MQEWYPDPVRTLSITMPSLLVLAGTSCAAKEAKKCCFKFVVRNAFER